MSLAKYGKYALKKYPAARKRYRVYAPAVKQLASDVMYLKGLINSEPHNHIVQTSNNYSYNGTIVSLCSIPQGDTSGSRTGDRVLPRYLSLHLSVRQGINGAYATHVTHRVIIFRSWIENASTSSVTLNPDEVLATTGSQYAPLSHLKSTITGSKGDRNRRIEILRNELFTLDQVGDTSRTWSYNIEMNGKQKGNKEHIEFISSSTGEPCSGGIYVMLINDQPVANAGQQAFYLESRLTFYDN